MLIPTSPLTSGFREETPPEPGGIRERVALESGNGGDHTVPDCPTDPQTGLCRQLLPSLPWSMHLSRGVRGIPFSLVEKGQDLFPKACRSFRTQMTLTMVSCFCGAFS